jgi:hypothetical protein
MGKIKVGSTRLPIYLLPYLAEAYCNDHGFLHGNHFQQNIIPMVYKVASKGKDVVGGGLL